MRKACKHFAMLQVASFMIHTFLGDRMSATAATINLSIAMLASIPALVYFYDIIVPEHGKLAILLLAIVEPVNFLSEIFIQDIFSGVNWPSETSVTESLFLKIIFALYLIAHSWVSVTLLRKPVPWLGSADGP